MHQLVLLLLLHLFALHLTDIRCWAQESTPTTTTPTATNTIISTTLPSFNDDTTITDSTTQEGDNITTMTANPDSPTPFQLHIPSTISQCEDAVLTWSGGNTVPLYEVYFAEGSGETGDESALGEEKWLGSSGGNNFTWKITQTWNTTIGDAVRFRVADHNGRGQNATTWAKIAAGNVNCFTNPAPALAPPTSLIVSVPTTETITSKTSLAAQSIPSSISSPAESPVQTTSDSSTTSPSEVAVPAPAPTETGNPVNDPPTVGDQNTDGSTNQGEGSQQGSDDGVTLSFETVVQGGTTFVFGGADPQPTGGSDSNQTISPGVTAAQDSNDTAQSNMSGKTVGTIVGTVLGLIAVLIVFLIWLRKRQKARVFHPMQEEEEGSRMSHSASSSSPSSSSQGMRGAMKTLLTVPGSLVSLRSKQQQPTQVTPYIVEPLGGGGGARSLSPRPSMMSGESGTYSQFLTTPEAYTGAGDTFSALNSPDPFRRSFGAQQVPTVL